jgi:hypothetical protein
MQRIEVYKRIGQSGDKQMKTCALVLAVLICSLAASPSHAVRLCGQFGACKISHKAVSAHHKRVKAAKSLPTGS